MSKDTEAAVLDLNKAAAAVEELTDAAVFAVGLLEGMTSQMDRRTHKRALRLTGAFLLEQGAVEAGEPAAPTEPEPAPELPLAPAPEAAGE